MFRRAAATVLAGLLSLLVVVCGIARPAAAARACCKMSCCPDGERAGGATIERASCCKRAPSAPDRGQPPAPTPGQLPAFTVVELPTIDAPASTVVARRHADPTAARAPSVRTLWLELRSLLI